MPRASVILILLLLLLTVTVSYAQDVTRTFAINPDSLTPAKLRSARFQNVKGYRLGIALSGGGARGLAQIGVLDELTRAGIDIDLVAGTSMGGIIGGLYALGMSPAEIEATTEGIDWSSLFSDKPGRRSLLFSRRAETEGELLTLRFDGFNPRIPTALSSGQKLFNVLNSLTQIPAYFSKGDFANLDRKLAIVSTDIVTGEKVVFTSGSLVMAMRATTGVPLAFTPLEDGDRLLMDGGLLDPIPTDEVRKLGADFVIAVNTTSSLLPKEEITNPVDIANQTTTILQATTQRRLLEQADLVITPNLTGIKATDFSKIPDVIEAGRLAARSLIDSLRQLLAERNSTSFNLSVNSIMVACVDGDQPLSPSHRKAVADLQALSGQILGQTDIDRAVYRLFKSGFWSKIGYQLQPSNTGRKLLVSVTPFPTIKSIRICGNQVFADSTLLRVSGADTADIHSLARLVDIYDRILDHYHCYVYDLAQIKNASLGEKNHI
ncbi:MAG: patatin-like phospholipase family protein, partial [candidate division Zixibacteria bacterium]|nr:patatin-like phospholipase family protein [candidate division Zixibacteria bacterium]